MTYDGNKELEIQVNPEFSTAEATGYAEEYATVIGRLPRALLRDLKTVWIHNGDENFGGGNNSFDIYVGLGNRIKGDGFLEEILIHEGTHVSLDNHHKDGKSWQEAQQNDPAFISTYARDNRTREDLAESFLLYFALRYRPESLTDKQRNTILATMPNRIAYFDSQDIDYFPFGE